MRQYINWKIYLIFIALFIVAASLFYTNTLASKLANEEKKKVELLLEAMKTANTTFDPQAIKYTSMVVDSNKTIPLILTNDSDRILDNVNLDTNKIKHDDKYLSRMLSEFKSKHPPIVFDFGSGQQYVYYGESFLLTELRYFPYVQLAIIFLFLVVVVIAITSANRSIQNQVWVGLSKETAHQLGTPLSSIEAWVELLKEQDVDKEIVDDLSKDLDRLKLVADRFGKVGNTPQMEEEDLMKRLQDMVDYMQKRAPNKVFIRLKSNEDEIPAYISGPLFDWVIENLMRNSLDAMEGKGEIEVQVTNNPTQIWIDLSDTGKGIPKHQIKKIFNPGFTTKKRGWGLGLSLSKRIIEKYHHGSLLVKNSEVGKGTTFRIILRR